MKHINIAIIGAGIAGLSAAVACHQKKIDAHIFETTSSFKPLGTSLSLWPNAMRCLQEWGLDRAIARSGSIIDQIAWRRPDGKPYFTQPLGPLYKTLGNNGYCVRRSDLHAKLVSAIPPENLHLNSKLIESNIVGGKVNLIFENGTQISANHVIAADGLWSSLRQKLLGDQVPTYSGYGAWLGLSSIEAPKFAPGEGCEFLGPNARLGVFETGSNTRYWFMIANSKTPTKHARLAHWNEMQSILDQWPVQFRHLVLDTSIAAPIYVSFYDRYVSETWGSNHFTLIGDAMHPFVPNLGQGACQAIEDAHCLAEGLDNGVTGGNLNNWMCTHRLARVRYMRRTANQIGKLAQNTSTLSRVAVSLLGKTPLRQKMHADLGKQFKRPTLVTD